MLGNIVVVDNKQNYNWLRKTLSVLPSCHSDKKSRKESFIDNRLTTSTAVRNTDVKTFFLKFYLHVFTPMVWTSYSKQTEIDRLQHRERVGERERERELGVWAHLLHVEGTFAT